MQRDFNPLAIKIKELGKQIGADAVAITDPSFMYESKHFEEWVHAGYNAGMKYFEKHFDVYEHPQKLLTENARNQFFDFARGMNPGLAQGGELHLSPLVIPHCFVFAASRGEISIICCRFGYPKSESQDHPIASFAQIQDYSTHIRNLLEKFVTKIISELGLETKTRVFAGNAPILEKALAAKAGLGWYGKNSILLCEELGSFFFLGEIFIDLPLPVDQPARDRCGACNKCQESCPTKAIVAPYTIDARRCIAYLTGENKGAIPVELRPLIGNKIFGCDICQLVCPWNNTKNKTAPSKNQHHFWQQTAFIPKKATAQDLLTWFLWEEPEFIENTKNTPMHRLSHERWLRNLAVALGNAKKSEAILEVLKTRQNHPAELVREHVAWAIEQQNHATT